ncbi:hypothetical protein [Accumulibacter sp.]|uniref:hypothetical protein n=1 Tax=Accumulibacter sp. TaxID=2053492 RepID=UPI0025F1C964|nr:hypothetical protein [Accumulibacter sp.]MCM8593875.1 hypothetical protein [Accumulibacter sp.]MCM8626083.1 hypothetical protein [Accumulibacter sp.]MDS4048016.1 hypothetical protein [Accumulibacter sp.]
MTSSELFTSWSDHDRAVQRMFELVRSTLLVFDGDLSHLALERPERIAALRRVLGAADFHRRVTIVVRRADFVRQYCPQLIELLANHAPTLTIIHAPPQIAAASESLLIADGEHALVRFDDDQPRCRLITGNSTECAPYLARFAEILGEGGDPLSATTLGL